ncbi:hypothetical protein QQX98_009276 [Neonectria punicea]|uniref:Uncharacterized protein n=1 Tax=Neonectria punicea TaxID=979145 RepID=A0ABR1GST4_9HYPO
MVTCISTFEMMTIFPGAPCKTGEGAWFSQLYEINALKDLKDVCGLLGGFEQNLAYNYNTVNDHETALTWFEKSRDTWIAWNIKEGREADWPTVTKRIWQDLQRRRGKPEAAEASFMEARNLWMRGDQTRLHPFHAACIYKTGVVCLDQGKVEAAIKHLRDSLEITKFHANVMPPEHARGLLKLSEALLQDSHGNSGEVVDLRD